VIVDHGPGTPEIFKLSLGPITPNPTISGTTISFEISGSGAVLLSVYNVEGELVKTLFAGEAPAGRNHVAWDGTDTQGMPVARGVYFCRIEAGAETATEKIVFMK
jgi:flagellar hook assembly protein FlgD